MDARLLRSRALPFLFQCITLGSPPARIVAVCAAIVVLSTIDIGSLGLPELCLWEKIFGWCPARGTTHALNAFFHGEWAAAVHYNLNVFLIIPVAAGMLSADIVRVIKRPPLGRRGE
jgi:hypothetical protein